MRDQEGGKLEMSDTATVNASSGQGYALSEEFTLVDEGAKTSASTFGGPVSFEQLFRKEILQLVQKLASSADLVVTVRDLEADFCKVLNADRANFYRLDVTGKNLVTQITLPGGSKPDLKIPITSKSVAGYVARTKAAVNLTNVYDDVALKAISADLHFLKGIDSKTGYKTRELIAVPVQDKQLFLGVLQVVNNKSEKPFNDLELEGAKMLAKAIAQADIKNRNLVDDSPEASTEAGVPVQKPIARLGRPGHRYDDLVKAGLLSDSDFAKARASSGKDDAHLENILIRKFRITPAQVGLALSRYYEVPYEAYQSRRAKVEGLHAALRSETAISLGWVALSEEDENTLLVLCVDPEAVKFTRLVGQTYPKFTKFQYRVTTHKEFRDTVEQLAVNGIGSIDHLLSQLTKSGGEESAKDPNANANPNADVEDNETVRIVNKIITDACEAGASDIHIEPGIGNAKVLIRLRIDGALETFIELPNTVRSALISRIKIMADLDISESRRPQDGKITFRKYGPLDIELRVATIPSSGGIEDVVMRILAAGEPIPLDELGLLVRNKERLLSVITKPYGLFYVCGPTGSGKTTTLHSILSYLNTSEAKIWTAEDPVEITQKGLRQVQVNKKAGVDFATLMRAFLRADPDIIMVGESRDLETVSMGVEASLTGHMVLSTLHTNSAPEAITRLLDMGMDPFNFADALLGILAQRLAKRLCSCKQAYKPSKEEIRSFMTEYATELRATEPWQKDPEGELKRTYAQLKEQYAHEGQWRFYKPVGCELCRKTGYKGRVGLHELLLVDEKIKLLIHERARVSLIFTAAVAAGMVTLKMDGMEKIMAGLTDLKQVRAVCIK
jgi:type II secretory ATPase GspE/PulE/Tfp pilus assembly ATPase PilB-like protein